MNKKIIALLALSLFFVESHFLFAGECKYKTEWEQCDQANKGNWNPRDFDPESDFLCVSSLDRERLIYNLILDKHFKQIDKKADEYLEALEKNKDYYFWYNRKAPYLKAIDEVEKYFSVGGIFYQKYFKECSARNPKGVLTETYECLWWKGSARNAGDFINESLCMRLAIVKNDVRKSVAYDILSLNKESVRKDEKKMYDQQQRSNYELVVDLFMVNIGYILRLVDKWASKTRHPY